MKFDPFENRNCRDIRNALGHHFVTAIEKCSKHLFKDQAKALLSDHQETHISAYIRDLCHKFDIAFSQIYRPGAKKRSFFGVCAALWNLGLFFEYHEWLEGRWMKAKGDEKKMLQALIMAAVVYEQLQYGRKGPAGKLGSKTAARLENSRKHLPPGIDCDRLTQSLRALSPPPKFYF